MPKKKPTSPQELISSLHLGQAAVMGQKCPKCGGMIRLEDAAEYLLDKPWRPTPNTEASQFQMFWVKCEHSCWIGPRSGDPERAAADWNAVMKKEKQ